MDYSVINSWLENSKNIYITIKSTLEAVEEPNEALRQRVVDTFSQMEDYLGSNYDMPDLDVVFHFSILYALVKYELGKIHFWSLPERAEKYFSDAWAMLINHQTDPDHVLLSVCILNELSAMALHKKLCAGEVKCYFKVSQHLWKNYQKQSAEPVLPLECLFLSKADRKAVRMAPTFDPVHNLHTVLKQSYSESLAVNLLKGAEEILKDYDEPFIWSRTMFRLADIYITAQRFYSARHILSYANVLLIQDQVTLRRRGKNDDKMRKTCEHVKAKVDDYWGYYSMLLLSVSRKNNQLGKTEIDSFYRIHHMHLSNECKEKVAHFEKKIPFTLVSNHEEAAEVLTFGKKHLDSAQLYYAQNAYMEEFMSTIENTNNLYESTLHFQENETHVYEMHKSIISETLTKLIHFDSTVHSHLYKRSLFLLTGWYVRTLYLKIASFKDSEVISQDKNEVHDLCSNLIAYSSLLLNHFPHEDILPDYYSVTDARYVLHACVSMCNAHLVLYTLVDENIDNLQKGEMYGSKVVFYIKKHPNHAVFVGNMLEKLKGTVTMIENLVSTVANAVRTGQTLQ